MQLRQTKLKILLCCSCSGACKIDLARPALGRCTYSANCYERRQNPMLHVLSKPNFRHTPYHRSNEEKARSATLLSQYLRPSVITSTGSCRLRYSARKRTAISAHKISVTTLPSGPTLPPVSQSGPCVRCGLKRCPGI